jgi:hypothetical protein
MTRLSLFVLFLFVLTECKREDPEPLAEVESIVGKWRAVQTTQTLGDSTTTQSVPNANAWVYEFRFDGVLLNKNGNRPCCIPSIFLLNGNEFKPSPSIPVELDPSCDYALCASCPEMNITQTSPDTIRIETCKGAFTTFAKEN